MLNMKDFFWFVSKHAFKAFSAETPLAADFYSGNLTLTDKPVQCTFFNLKVLGSTSDVHYFVGHPESP